MARNRAFPRRYGSRRNPGSPQSCSFPGLHQRWRERTMTGSLKEYAELYRLGGPWCTAYVDAGTGTVDTLEAADVRPGNIRAALEAAGASPADLDAMEQALQPEAGVPSPVSRFVLVHQGKAELNEVLPGDRVGAERISVDPIPD